MTTTANIHDILAKAGIKPTAQRIAVTRYLTDHITHPCVDEIYSHLLEDYPTLSRTTVYNTVKVLHEHGFVNAIDIDPAEGQRYDINTEPHAHFICTSCSGITDIPLSQLPQLPPGYEADEIQVSYRGICPNCRKKETTTI